MSYTSFHDAKDSCKDYYKYDTQQPERSIESVKCGCHEYQLTIHTGYTGVATHLKHLLTHGAYMLI